MEYIWDITYINDSVTKVNVGIKDLNHSIQQVIGSVF
jgi:hypothetical protein